MKTAQGRSPVEAAARAHSVEVYASFLLPRLAGGGQVRLLFRPRVATEADH